MQYFAEECGKMERSYIYKKETTTFRWDVGRNTGSQEIFEKYDARNCGWANKRGDEESNLINEIAENLVETESFKSVSTSQFLSEIMYLR